jgi:hypothetical protein
MPIVIRNADNTLADVKHGYRTVFCPATANTAARSRRRIRNNPARARAADRLSGNEPAAFANWRRSV